MLVGFWSPKGGSGVSVLTATCALIGARFTRVTLVDCAGDLPAVLGLASDTRAGIRDLLALEDPPPDALDRITVQAAPNLQLLTAGSIDASERAAAGERLAAALRVRTVPAFVDLGVPTGAGVRALAEHLDTLVMVVRPCYLAYRRATGHPLASLSRGAVVIDEPNRVLSARDLEQVVGIPILATITPRPTVARAVDAGTLASRIPEPLARPTRSLIESLGFPAPRLLSPGLVA